MEFASDYVLLADTAEEEVFDAAGLVSAQDRRRRERKPRSLKKSAKQDKKEKPKQEVKEKKSKDQGKKKGEKKEEKPKQEKEQSKKKKVEEPKPEEDDSASEEENDEETGSGSSSGQDEGSEELLALSDDEGDVVIPESRVRKVRKADTNICAVNLGTLEAEAVVLFTGDAVLCQGCGAAMTELSKITVDNVGGGQLWVCEYCDHHNQIHLDQEEIPNSSSIDYLLVPPVEKKGESDDIIVFCIDVSGSMCCTSEITGDIKIKADSSLHQSLSTFIDANRGGGYAEQFLPNENRDVTYVSRLQCVQAAVSAQLENLVKTYPKKRVAIVTFSNDVTIHLPGGVKHVITGDHLYEYDYLIGAADKLNVKLDSPLEKTEKELTTIVHGLQESGATALGPALLVSVGLAGQTKGSLVVLCTDGVANVGLGTLENYSSVTANSHPATAFYQKAADTATGLGVAVAIISIKGTNTSLELIAKVAAQTKGYNDVVDPLKLTKNFNFVLQNNIIATDVTTQMFLHSGLQFKHEDHTKDSLSCIKEIGNVTKESTITFEYVVSDKAKVASLKKIPFQIQIRFTKLNGSKCLRVLSRVADVTDSREQAENKVNVNILGLHSHQQTAKLASEGNYTKARMVQKANMRLVRRALDSASATEEQQRQYTLWNAEALRLNDAIKATKIEEGTEGLDYDSARDDASDAEDESALDEDLGKRDEKVAEKKQQKEERKKERKVRRAQNDTLSNVLYQAQNPLFSAFTFDANPLYSDE